MIIQMRQREPLIQIEMRPRAASVFVKFVMRIRPSFTTALTPVAGDGLTIRFKFNRLNGDLILAQEAYDAPWIDRLTIQFRFGVIGDHRATIDQHMGAVIGTQGDDDTNAPAFATDPDADRPVLG